MSVDAARAAVVPGPFGRAADGLRAPPLTGVRRIALQLVAATAVGGLYAVGAVLPFWFLTSPEGGAAFFPSAGLTLALLVVTDRRSWPYWLLAVAVAEVLVDVTHGQNLPMALGFAVANVVEPLVGACALRRAVGHHRTALRDNFIAFVVLAVAAGPLVGASIGATVSAAFGGDAGWASIAGKWWLGDALGVLVVATPIIAWRARTPGEKAIPAWELAAIVTLSTAVVLIPALLWRHPTLYAVLPVLMWAAVRGGVRAVSVAGVFVACATDWAAVTGRASQLLASTATDDHLIFVQIFLALTLLAALMLAIEVTERRRLEQVARDAELERSRAERAATDAAAVERRRLARETHDIAGHALNVMLLHAGAARRTIDGDPALTRQLLESIEDAGRTAFQDLDVALRLGEWDPDHLPRRGVGHLGELVEVWQQAGMSVTLEIDGAPRKLASLVDWSAYRIVQEALTNAAKYAPGATVRVTVAFDEDALAIAVVDDGGIDGAVPGRGGGRGLLGMRERATALSGQLETGPRGLGFAVRARLPAPSVPR